MISRISTYTSLSWNLRLLQSITSNTQKEDEKLDNLPAKAWTPERMIAALVKASSDWNIWSLKQMDMANLQEVIPKLREVSMGHQGKFECIDTFHGGNDDLVSGSQSMSSLHLLFFTERS